MNEPLCPPHVTVAMATYYRLYVDSNNIDNTWDHFNSDGNQIIKITWFSH